MALVYAVAQQKGGAGKTMLAANLAAAWSRDRHVAVIDVDPQGSLGRWHALRGDHVPPAAAVTLAEVAGWRLGAEIDRLRRIHDVVLIDTPPQLDLAATLAVRGADLVLLPVQPSAPDLWAAEGTVKLAAAERRPLLAVLNRLGSVVRVRDAFVAEIEARGLRLATATLGNRTAFATSFAGGLGVTEGAPRSQAAAEVRALASELEAAHTGTA